MPRQSKWNPFKKTIQEKYDIEQEAISILS